MTDAKAAYMKEYSSRPEVKARRSAYHRWYYSHEDNVKSRKVYNKKRESNPLIAEMKRQQRRKRWTERWNEYVCYQLKQRAKRLGLPFNLVPEDLVLPSVCPVLGITLIINTRENGTRLNSPSVDRIVPNRGYVKGNIVIVSMRANTLKSNATPDELQKLASFYKSIQSEPED